VFKLNYDFHSGISIAVMLVLTMEEIYNISFEVGFVGMLYVKGCLEIGTNIQEILRFCLGNSKTCNVGVTD
jgi:hypothetical protein